MLGLGSAAPYTLKAQGSDSPYLPCHLEQSDSVSSLKDLLSSVESQLFEKTNQQRKDKKLSSLEFNITLYKAALFHSQDMLKRRYFSHFSPEGKFVLDRIRKFKPGYDESCGENLHQIYSEKGLRDPSAIAEQMMKDWMSSPEHRKNILSKEYTLMGIACSSDGFRIFCTQVFSAGPL